MSTQALIGWLVGALVVLGGGYFLLASSQDNSMMKDTDAMDGETMENEGDAMIEKEGDAMEGDSMEKKGDAMSAEGGSASGGMESKGTYQDYSPEKLALANSGKVLLFFHAPWCPVCSALEKEIMADLSVIPAGVHILKVDYDTATALKRKYGVTYQHTFVQVDAKGTQIAKWGDAFTMAQVAARIK